MLLRPGDPAPAALVEPISGLPVDTARGPLVVLFLRPLTGGLARVAIATVQAAMARFDAEAIRIVAFTRADLTMARDYVPRHHVLFPVVVDPDGRHFDAWGVTRDRHFRQSLLGMRPSALSALGSAMRVGPPSLDDQLPAAFAVGRDGRIRYARVGPTVFALPDLEALRSACGS